MSTDSVPRVRRPNRYAGYDYSQFGRYFVTICVRGRLAIFGENIRAKMYLLPIGEIVHTIWTLLPQRFPYVQLDEYIIMADHLHGIIIIDDKIAMQMNTKPHTLGWIIGQFKGASTFLIRPYLPEFQWQRNFYEHIIRNDKDLDRIRRYIIDNPQRQWATSHPANP